MNIRYSLPAYLLPPSLRIARPGKTMASMVRGHRPERPEVKKVEVLPALKRSSLVLNVYEDLTK